MQSLLYATLLAGATFIWGYIFYKKDYHPQPLKVIAQIFGIGLFSMLPLFGYKYLYQNFLPFLAEYEILKPFIEGLALSGVTFFVLNLILLSAILFTLTAIVALVLTLFKKETRINIKKAVTESEFIAVSVIVGLLIYLERFAEGLFNIPIVNTILGTILILTVIEEFIKHLVVRFVDDKKIKDIDDAITLSVMVGLAFASVETMMYAINSGDLSLIVYRSFITLPIHVVASGIFGYYYGLAHFAKPMLASGEERKAPRYNWIHKILKLKKETVYEEEKLIEGLALATLFHGAANVLFELNLAFVVVPFIVLGLILLAYFYNESHILYKLLRIPKRRKTNTAVS